MPLLRGVGEDQVKDVQISEADKTQGQVRFCGESTTGLRNRLYPSKIKEADYQVSKGSHNAGSVSGPDC